MRCIRSVHRAKRRNISQALLRNGKAEVRRIARDAPVLETTRDPRIHERFDLGLKTAGSARPIDEHRFECAEVDEEMFR